MLKIVTSRRILALGYFSNLTNRFRNIPKLSPNLPAKLCLGLL